MDCGGRALLPGGRACPGRGGRVLAPASPCLLPGLETAPGSRVRPWRLVRDPFSGGLRYAPDGDAGAKAEPAPRRKLDYGALSDWPARESRVLDVLVAACHGRVHAVADGLAASGAPRGVSDVRAALCLLLGVGFDAGDEARRRAALLRLQEHRPAELQAEQAALALALSGASAAAHDARRARLRLLALHAGASAAPGVALQVLCASSGAMPDALGMSLAAAAAASGLPDPGAAAAKAGADDRRKEARSHKKKKRPAPAPAAAPPAAPSESAARAERRLPPAGPATYARSTRHAPVRGAPARAVDRMLAELGLSAPLVPTRAVLLRFGDLRAAAASLVEAQRAGRDAEAHAAPPKRSR